MVKAGLTKLKKKKKARERGVAWKAQPPAHIPLDENKGEWIRA